MYIYSITLTCSLTYKFYTCTYANIHTFTHKHTNRGGVIEYLLNKSDNFFSQSTPTLHTLVSVSIVVSVGVRVV